CPDRRRISAVHGQQLTTDRPPGGRDCRPQRSHLLRDLRHDGGVLVGGIRASRRRHARPHHSPPGGRGPQYRPSPYDARTQVMPGPVVGQRTIDAAHAKIYLASISKLDSLPPKLSIPSLGIRWLCERVGYDEVLRVLRGPNAAQVPEAVLYEVRFCASWMSD